jgi:CubicO group peptidase (beta-lactamase class C family)
MNFRVFTQSTHTNWVPTELNISDIFARSDLTTRLDTWATRNPFDEIPVINLLNYGSGLPDDNRDATDLPNPFRGSPYTLAAMREFLATTNLSLVAPSGAEYTYSNLGFAMAGALHSEIQSGPFENHISTSVFGPCQMSRAAGFLNSTGSPAENPLIPKGYRFPVDDAQTPVEMPAGWDVLPAYNPAGGIVLSAKDMMQWLLVNMNQLVLKPNSLTEPLQAAITRAHIAVHPSPRASGWFIKALAPEKDFLWKNGMLKGASSYIAFQARDSSGKSAGGAFVLCNAHAFVDDAHPNRIQPADDIAGAVVRLMYGVTAAPTKREADEDTSMFEAML